MVKANYVFRFVAAAVFSSFFCFVMDFLLDGHKILRMGCQIFQ